MIKNTLLAGVGAVSFGFASSAMAATAGNIVLTGHDDDFHCDKQGDGNACAQIGAMLGFVRGASALPVLVIDSPTSQSGGAGNELANSISALIGGGNIVTKTPGSISGADFDHSLYSAFAVASVSTCGGCDNPTNTGSTLAAFSASIASFLNAGGGILGMTSNGVASGFDYVPEAASGSAIAHNSGFVATANGVADIAGFAAVNGDETHNIFPAFSGAYKVAEFDSTQAGDPAVTIYTKGAVETCTAAGTCHLKAPEPMSLSLLGAGLFGLGMARRRWRS